MRHVNRISLALCINWSIGVRADSGALLGMYELTAQLACEIVHVPIYNGLIALAWESARACGSRGDDVQSGRRRLGRVCRLSG